MEVDVIINMVGRQYGGYVQTGRGGDFPVFRGSRMQRGYGIGSILSGVLRTAIPFLKSGAKALGKEALRTGVAIGQDVLSRQKLKTAAKRRSLESVRNVATKSTRKLANKGKRIIRGTRKKKVTSSRAVGGKRRKRAPDIFDA